MRIRTTRSQRRDSRSRTSKLPKYSITLLGLSKWYKHLFEKFGWMIIANAKGYSSKIAEYKKSIHHFIIATKHLMNEYENHNRKHDLNVMIMNVEVLQQHVLNEFSV